MSLAQSGGSLVRRPKLGPLLMATCSYLSGNVPELLFALVDAVGTAFASAEATVTVSTDVQDDQDNVLS